MDKQIAKSQPCERYVCPAVFGAGTGNKGFFFRLVLLWRITQEEFWINAARRVCHFYRDRDLVRFECKAGALDTYCIDKESSGPLLEGSLVLYEADGTEEWLKCAELADWYFGSWMFHHDTIPRPGSDFEQYEYRILGVKERDGNYSIYTAH